MEEEDDIRKDNGRCEYHLLTHFHCDMCNFRNIQGMEPGTHMDEDERLMASIRRGTLGKIRSREPGIVRGSFIMINKWRRMAKEELGLDDWLLPMGPYTLKDAVDTAL